jgi:hypothetical protein
MKELKFNKTFNLNLIRNRREKERKDKLLLK